MPDSIRIIELMNNGEIRDSVGGGRPIRQLFHQQHHSIELFERMVAAENIFAAWEKFRRGKRKRPDVLSYEQNLEENLFDLQTDLKTGAYRHGTYQPFTVFDPKKRRIHKATVRDRVVHQALVNVLEPIYERQFIFDSFSCRCEKGTHAAVRRLRLFLRRASSNNTRTVYALKCDIKKFFDSVDHHLLFQFLAERVTDYRFLAVLWEIINSFRIQEGKGLPLGNLTSQLFANVYLHELDRFMKFQVQEKFYVRYCDDFVVVSTSRLHLEQLVRRLDGFLHRHLLVELHPSKVSLRTWAQGIDFLGYVLLPQATVLRTKTKRRMIQRANPENLSSYLGLCKHADAHESAQVLRQIAGGEVAEVY